VRETSGEGDNGSRARGSGRTETYPKEVTGNIKSAPGLEKLSGYDGPGVTDRRKDASAVTKALGMAKKEKTSLTSRTKRNGGTDGSTRARPICKRKKPLVQPVHRRAISPR